MDFKISSVYRAIMIDGDYCYRQGREAEEQCFYYQAKDWFSKACKRFAEAESVVSEHDEKKANLAKRKKIASNKKQLEMRKKLYSKINMLDL
ncbi:MAG: hypothetical protein IKM43_02220 [Clostridia bacterium]|nr:hypothetical protein [Clostridia bacterium]